MIVCLYVVLIGLVTRISSPQKKGRTYECFLNFIQINQYIQKLETRTKKKIPHELFEEEIFFLIRAS